MWRRYYGRTCLPDVEVINYTFFYVFDKLQKKSYEIVYNNLSNKIIFATKYLFIVSHATNLIIDISSRYLYPKQRNKMLNRMRTKVQLRVSPVLYDEMFWCETMRLL